MSQSETGLSVRIQAELSELERIVTRIFHLLNKAETQKDDDYLDGVALNLHSFYADVERIFEQIARDVDQSLPAGPDWHRSLLLQVSVPVPNVRPPVVSRTTRDCLDEYRAFRHVVRNVYTFNLRSTRIRELVTELQGCFAALTGELTEFRHFLDELNDPPG